jgi:hypothetical protein
MQTSGAMRREIAEEYSVVIVRDGGRSSIPEAAVIEPISRGVLDTPPSRGTTAGCGGRRRARTAPETGQQATPRSC